MNNVTSRTNNTQPREEVAAAYLRARCDTPQEEEQSISAQQQRIDDYAKQHGLRIVRLFVDRCCGAGTGPALAEMYEFLEQHPEVRSVIVDSLTRLTRNMSEASLCAIQWQLHIVDCGFVTRVQGARPLAKRYSQQISPSLAPFGYRNAVLPSGKRGLVPEPKEAGFIKRCFELFSKGTSKRN